MKKLFFIAAIAGAALVSCTKNELAPSATEQHEITFASPVTSVLTKTSVDLVRDTYPTGTPFAVFADYHTQQYLSTGNNTLTNFSSYMRGNNATREGEGVKVIHDATNLTVGTAKYDSYWRPAGGVKYYWPMEGYLTFAAYSPYDITGYDEAKFNYSFTNGVKIEGYTVSAANQYDLMFSDRAINQERAKMQENWNETSYDGVNINFRHALSAVRFEIATKEDYSTNDGYTIRLNVLNVNAYSTGDFTQFEDIDSKDADNIWENQGTATSYTVLPYTEENGEEINFVELSTTMAPLGTDDDNTNLVLLPQKLVDTKNTDSKDDDYYVTVTINYTVFHADYPEDGITYTKPIEIATSTVDEWVAGKRYLYTITIGMEEIVFAPTVTDWVDAKDKDINL